MTKPLPSPDSLLSKPSFDLSKNTLPELPVNTVSDKLSRLSGAELQISTRSNATLNKAVAFGFVYTTRFKSTYVAGRLDELMRLAISYNGLGRTEQIECLRAGGVIPDAYYSGNKTTSEASYIREDI